MKRLLLCALLGLGLSFGAIDARGTAAADTIVAAPTTEPAFDTSNRSIEPVASLAESRIESLLQSLDRRLEQVEERTRRLEHTPRQQAPYFSSEYLMASLAIFMSSATVVLIVFLSLRNGYRKRKLRYELDRLAIEHGCYPMVREKAEIPTNRFLRRLLIVGIVGFCILAWTGVVQLSHLSFFSAVLLWGLIAGVGYAVVYLFRLYTQHREENR